MEFVWLIFGIVVLFVFGVLEAYAFRYRVSTLSHAISSLARDFPLTVWAAGFFTGAIAIHLFGLCEVI